MLKDIVPDQLRVGMYVEDLHLSWFDHGFARSRFPIRDDAMVAQIRASGTVRVTIDIAKGVDVQEPVVAAAPVAPSAPAPVEPPQPAISQRTPLAREMRIAHQLNERARGVIKDAMADARLGQISGLKEVESLAGEMVGSVSRNPGALISLSGLKTKDDYTFTHCVAVGTLMIALGKQLGLSEAELKAAGTAGLLHDVGKAHIPDEILNKPGRLTDEEFTIIRGHPTLGHRVLVEAGHPDRVALDVVLHHHEKLDGTGYPDRLKGDQVTLLARMGAVADVYDAVTSDRVYHRAIPPTAALRMLLASSGSHFDESVARAFVKCIGIYPVRSLVKLSSGRLAVVVEQNEHNPASPRVRIFFSLKSNAHIPMQDLDLASNCGDKIVSFEDPVQWGLDINRYMPE